MKHWRRSVVLLTLIALSLCVRERCPSVHAADADGRSRASEPNDDQSGDDQSDDDQSGGNVESERDGRSLLDKLNRLGELSLEEAWTAVEQMRIWFKIAPPDLARILYDRVESMHGRAKLLTAELLTTRREDSLYHRGQHALIQIARDDEDRETRIAALRLLAGKSYSEAAYLALDDITKMETEPDVLIEACLALWGLENKRRALRPIFQMLTSGDLQLQYKAALALAEIGHYSLAVDERLRNLQSEPSARGRRARLFLEQLTGGSPSARRSDEATRLKSRIRELERELDRSRRSPAGRPDAKDWPAMLDEVVNKVLRYSFRSHELSRRDLYVAALKGVLSSPDPYSRFLGPTDVERQEAQQSGFYGGFGLRLIKPAKNEPLVVVKAYKGGPAFLHGLRTGDRLLALNGVATAQHPIGLFESWTHTAESLTLLVRRWGWDEPRLFSIRRSRIEIPYVKWRLLPHDVGYIQVVLFGKHTLKEFEKALSALVARGIKQLIVDLRNNRGGLLSEAIGLVNLFVSRDRGLPIVTLRGSGSKAEVFHPTSRERSFASPLVVLVNRYTASAAELVAGALQDLGRARVVGERTYGKGLEQRVLNLPAGAGALLGGKGKLIISTRSIHLPMGRTYHARHDANGRPSSSHKGGIVPDVVEESYRHAYTTEQLLEFDSITFSRPVDAFIHANFQTILNRHDEGDQWDPAEATEFEDLYEELETRLTRGDVQRAVRFLIQLHLEDESGEDIIGAFAEDLQLQRAILEVLIQGGYPREDLPQAYREIAEAHFGAEELQRRGR